jgi:tetratricopeptide (TPR) repeat protein
MRRTSLGSEGRIASHLQKESCAHGTSKELRWFKAHLGRVRIDGLRAYLSAGPMLVILSCHSQSDPSSNSSQDSRYNGSPTVEWAGCSGVREGPVCELAPDGQLTIWIADIPRTVQWRFMTDKGMASVRKVTEVEGGTQVLLQVPTTSARLWLDGNDRQSPWDLRLRTPSHHEDLDALLSKGRTGEYQGAYDGLKALRTRVTRTEQGPVDAGIGRMALALGKVDEAEVALRASFAAAEADGRVADVIRDGAALVWALVYLRQRYSDARVLLSEMSPYGLKYPEGGAWLDYHEGLLAEDTADIRTALAKYRRAERAAKRLGISRIADDSAMEIARVLIRIGRADEAVAIMRNLGAPVDSCARATRALNLAWAETERASQAPPDDGPSKQLVAVTEAMNATKECPDPHRRTMAAIYFVELAIETGRDDPVVEQLVGQLQTLSGDRDALRSAHSGEVVGRWYLKHHNPNKALAYFEKSLPSSRAVGLVDEAFRAEVGAGRALLLLGRRMAGIKRLKAAQAMLEQMMLGIPFAEGRGTFLTVHDQGVRLLVSALAEGGETKAAFRAVRWTRAFELASATRLDRLAHLSQAARRRWDEALGRYQQIRAGLEHIAESDWSLPRAELARSRAERQVRAAEARTALDDAYRSLHEYGPADPILTEPGPSDLYLAFYPGSSGWLGFAATQSAVIIRKLQPGAFSSESGASQVLDLFDDQLKTATRVRLFPSGIADRVDWQLVRWSNHPLLELREVEYGLDVGLGSVDPGHAKPPKTALVVSNPTGDLPSATIEGDLVSQALAGWKVSRLEGRQASRSSVLHALYESAAFHYAGHAMASGARELSNSLVLNGGEQIDIGDVLAAPAVPSLVVLSACEAASSLDVSPSLMGLAQAFIASGSAAAIAPVRPVSDVAARRFASAFYSGLVAESSDRAINHVPSAGSTFLNSVRAGFRKAELTFSRGQVSIEGGQGFRLLVP